MQILVTINVICVNFSTNVLMYFIVHSGTVRRRWRPSAVDSRCDIEMVLEANHILVTNEQRNTILVTQELVCYRSSQSLPHLPTNPPLHKKNFFLVKIQTAEKILSDSYYLN